MGILLNAACRTAQAFLALGRALTPSKAPQTARDGDYSTAAAELLGGKKRRRVLVVCAPDCVAQAARLAQALRDAGLLCSVWDKAGAQPAPDGAENLRLFYLGEGCGCIAALGAEPVLDTAKLAAARLACPGLSVPALLQKGTLRKKTPLVLAVPSPDGCIAAASGLVRARDDAGRRFALRGRALTPRVAALDPAFCECRPESLKNAVAEALCLAVEAYLNPLYAGKKTRADAARAVELLLANAEPALSGDPGALAAVMEAQRLAALAADRTGPGYAGALAEAAAGICGAKRGEFCAAALPAVLESYGAKAQKPLAALAADALVKTDGEEPERAEALLWQLKNLPYRLGLPDTAALREDDVPELADAALTAANPRLCAPAVWTAKTCLRVTQTLRE